jgi:hypothetical protein
MYRVYVSFLHIRKGFDLFVVKYNVYDFVCEFCYSSVYSFFFCFIIYDEMIVISFSNNSANEKGIQFCRSDDMCFVWFYFLLDSS